MMQINNDHPLRRHFAGLIENAFYAEIGLCDPALTGYLADLLVSFTRADRLNAVLNARGKQIEQVAALLLVLSDDAPPSGPDRDRTLYRNIGDYALFWAGVYPEQLRQARRRASDILLDYVVQGKRSYAIASELTAENDAPPASLFRHLSDDFESCLHGLGLVRRELEDPGSNRLDSGGDLIF